MEDWLCFLGQGLCFCLISVWAYWLFTSDSDFTTFLYEIFGRSESAYWEGKVVWITGASSGIGEEIAIRLARYKCRLILSARRVPELQNVKIRCLGRKGGRAAYWEGKVVWITGASSGIGEEIAIHLARYKCRLILSARRVPELQNVKIRCLGRKGGRAAYWEGKVVWITGASSGIGEEIAIHLARYKCRLILSARRVPELQNVNIRCLGRKGGRAAYWEGKVVWITGASSGIGEEIAIHLARYKCRLILSARRVPELQNVNIRCLGRKGGRAAYWEGKVVWITGASSGIGEEIAIHLARYKCRLILSARRVPELQNVKIRCLGRKGGRAAYWEGKVVWITGASSGIGEEIAIHLARYKCRLILSARRVPELQNVKIRCLGRKGGRAAYWEGKVVWITGASSGIGEEIAIHLARYKCRLILSARRVPELQNVKIRCLGRKGGRAAYWEGKVVWITGASSGIGEEIAIHLARYKCRLILSARRVPELQNVKIRCLESNWHQGDEDIAVLGIDLSDLAALPDKASIAYSRFGSIDVIIHNAGRSQRADWASVEAAVDRECFELNALAPVVITRSLLSQLTGQAGGAQVVAVSSLAGVIPAPLSPSYTAAKHAMNGYFRSLWLENGDKGIRVSIVCPTLTFAPNNPSTAFTSTPGEAHGEVVERPGPEHMMPVRVAELVSVAAANDLAETWLARRKKLLFLAHINLLSPGLGKMILRVMGLERLRKIRTGR